MVRHKTVLKGQLLFKLGQTAEHAYLVMKGKLEERAERSSVEKQSKRDSRAQLLRPNDIAGELALQGLGIAVI